jgi:hypothetical protein
MVSTTSQIRTRSWPFWLRVFEILMLVLVDIGVFFTLLWPRAIQTLPTGDVASYGQAIQMSLFGVGTTSSTAGSIALGAAAALCISGSALLWFVLIIQAIIGHRAEGLARLAVVVTVGAFGTGLILSNSWWTVMPWLADGIDGVPVGPAATGLGEGIDANFMALMFYMFACGWSVLAVIRRARYAAPGGRIGWHRSAAIIMAYQVMGVTLAAFLGGPLGLPGGGVAGWTPFALVWPWLGQSGLVAVTAWAAFIVPVLLVGMALTTVVWVGRRGEAFWAPLTMAGLALLSQGTTALFLWQFSGVKPADAVGLAPPGVVHLSVSWLMTVSLTVALMVYMGILAWRRARAGHGQSAVPPSDAAGAVPGEPVRLGDRLAPRDSADAEVALA